MYAVIETGGKQYRVQEGDTLFVEKLDLILPEAEDAEGDAEKSEGAAVSVKFDKVLAVSDENGLTIGKPYVDGASVDASFVKHGKAKKIIVFKYKPKKGYRKKQGHRQPYTKVEIKKINV